MNITQNYLEKGIEKDRKEKLKIFHDNMAEELSNLTKSVYNNEVQNQISGRYAQTSELVKKVLDCINFRWKLFRKRNIQN